MKQDYTLKAKVRTELGKGASRRLRRVNDFVAGIIYGGEAEPTPIAIEKPALYKMIEEESFYSSIVSINVDGKVEQVVIRDLQRHPFKQLITHADFMRVNANEAITLTVQLHVTGQDACKGVKEDGGALHILSTDVEISCLPKDIPEFLEIDITSLAIGETLHLSDLKLPKGVEAVALAHGEDHNQALVTVAHPDRGDDEDDASEDASAAE